MPAFSKYERIIGATLGNAPWLKKRLKYCYQQINYLFYRKSYSYSCKYAVDQAVDSDLETFFGYYDKSPVNSSGQYMIYHETKGLTSRKPVVDEPIDLILYDLINKTELKRWSTLAYNWQQGAKLMWISDSSFIFNDYNEKEDLYFSRLIDANQLDSEQIINFPIYDAIENLAYSLNFDLLFKHAPDYGYRNRRDVVGVDQEADGIFKIDLTSGTRELMITIKQIIELHYDKCSDAKHHYLNHIMIAPDGEHIIFLHRWISRGRKFDALILSDTDGGNMKCLADDDMVSHCFWINPNEMVAYMNDEKSGNRYFRINIHTGERKLIGQDLVDSYGDGHPNVYGNRMVFDTYPDRSRMKKLFLFDFNSQQLEVLGEFFEPFKYYGETRCDLHPRYDSSGKVVYVDSVHTGKRKLYKIELGS